jgi:putative phosphoribosyl transferase
MSAMNFKGIDAAVGPRRLPGILRVPKGAIGVIIFAHGSGSSRFSPRNIFVAERFADSGFATLLFDLLSEEEAEDRRNVFDIPLLGTRMREAIAWASEAERIRDLPIGLFGASTGAAAALVAAAIEPTRVKAVVSRGGRPDLAAEALPQVRAPTLLIVGGLDYEVLELNREALRRLRCDARLDVVPGATHLFEEPGTLEQVVEHAANWFIAHVPGEGREEK